MKWNYWALLLMSVLLLSCEEPKDELAKEGSETDRIENPVCNEDSKNCDMNWVVTYPRSLFPETIQILVNNKVVFTECGDTKFAVSRMESTVEIMMYNYLRLAPKNKTQFSFEVKKVINCNDLKTATTFNVNNPQRYELEEIGNQTRVLVKN